MKNVFKIILLVDLFILINGSFHFYATHSSISCEDRDCFYSFIISDENGISEHQLVPYCIRNNIPDSTYADKRCYGEANYTFEQLKLKNIQSYDLYEWNATIDTINDFQKYLVEGYVLFADHLYCNCSVNQFGDRCEYNWASEEKDMDFNQIRQFQWREKRNLIYDIEITNNRSMLTCYEGFDCHSLTCLDWRHICDGILNCKNGEDEPDECILLEINQCQENEYRCRNGMCIPKTFLIDFSYDCSDLSDESEGYDNSLINFKCSSSPFLFCDFRRCPPETITCSDGQCGDISLWETVCRNGRHLFLSYDLLSRSSNTNISDECWFLMFCMSEGISRYFFHYDYDDCECSPINVRQKQCREKFQEHCPRSFFFRIQGVLDHLFVQFLYHNPVKYSSTWWQPTHICYNFTRCPHLPFTNFIFINDLMCVSVDEINFDDYVYDDIRTRFSACSITHKPILSADNRLYYCPMSMKYISKHRVKDGIFDCFKHEDENDENLTATFLKSLKLTDRFKCLTVDQWFPRPMLGDGICRDRSDKLFVGNCKKGSDFGCQFLRGQHATPIFYTFRDNCDDFSPLIITLENETDETSCEEWHAYRCDGRWDLDRGEDELNCSDTILSYLTHQVFKCNVNEHYCALPNGTMGCLSIQHIENGIIDCLGATDERQTSCDHPNTIFPFRCSSGDCISLTTMCDSIADCSNFEDSVMCQWSDNSICSDDMEFTCQNATCISKKKRCDHVIDCQPNGEDEWFCDLSEERSLQFSLDRMTEYPPVLMNLQRIYSNEVAPVENPSILSVNNIPFEQKNPLNNWFCNLGIMIRKQSSEMQCLCPPSYYGSRCEYQSERVFIAVRIDLVASMNRNLQQASTIRIIARLILDDRVFHNEEFLHIPLVKQMFYLNYPRPPPKQRGNWFVRFDAFLVTTLSVNFKAAWLFDVPFSFLPVNQLVLHLLMYESPSCSNFPCFRGQCKRYLNFPHDEYCHCEDHWIGRQCDVPKICSCNGNSKCLVGREVPICVCPLGRIGRECHALFNPCEKVLCKHHGKCLPLDERHSKQFICLCRKGYSGAFCETVDGRIDISFANSIRPSSLSLSTVLLIHFLTLEKRTPGVLFVQNRLLYSQVQLNKPLSVFNTNNRYLSSFILLEVFFEPDKIDYHIGAILKNDLTNISTTIDKSTRCPHVDELILNSTIRKFSWLKKVKYYHHICEISNIVRCFHDEIYLCFCDKYKQADCAVFPHESTVCPTNYCQNHGRCVQNIWNGIVDFACVCSGCAYGSLCQLTTSQYSLSLDIVLAQDIVENKTLNRQPFLIKIVFVIFILILLLGLMSNILSLITFKQAKIRQVGCGIYLLALPIVGQLGLSSVAGRFFYLLQTQIYNVENRLVARWSCIVLEYFITVCPMLFDWLIACVAVERCVTRIRGASFNKSNSVHRAKCIIFTLITLVLLSTWYEPFIRQLIDDPRSTTLHTWCVIKFQKPWVEYYRLAMNLINLVIPVCINLLATIFLLHRSIRMKLRFQKHRRAQNYCILFLKQLSFHGSSLALVILGLMRLSFCFTLVCITRPWQKYFYLIAYLISFVPLIATFPIFVLAAKTYRTEFRNCMKRTERALAIVFNSANTKY